MVHVSRFDLIPLDGRSHLPVAAIAADLAESPDVRRSEQPVGHGQSRRGRDGGVHHRTPAAGDGRSLTVLGALQRVSSLARLVDADDVIHDGKVDMVDQRVDDAVMPSTRTPASGTASGGRITTSKAKTPRHAKTLVGAAPKKGSSSYEVLMKAIGKELKIRDPYGITSRAMADPEAVARAVVDGCMSVADTWDETLGGFYDVDGVRHLLSGRDGPITKQAVSKRRNLLALTTGSGQVVYPIFQFTGSDVVDGLGEVLAALPANLVSRWTVASWLVSDQRDLDGGSPVDLLRAGARDDVVRAARRWASALAA